MSTRALLGVAVLSGLWAATPAYAVPISDTVDPNPNILITFTGTPAPCPLGFTCSVANLSWVHDITDNGFSVLDTIISATLVVHLTDTGGSETYTYTIGLGAQTQAEANVGATETDTVILVAPSIADLQGDGMIDVKITHTGAPGSSPATSFSYADSTLTVEVTKFVPLPDPEPEQTVPVPSSLFLLGIGLAILVGRSRRRI